MKLKIQFIVIALTSLLFNGCSGQEEQIAGWSFEKNRKTETLESVNNKHTPVESFKQNLELVPGISGKGLRTDGYSTFISTTFPEELSVPLSTEAWFALETYPTDTAGFFSFEKDDNNWIAANIDQFGELMLSVCTDGEKTWFPSSSQIKKFEWFKIALSITENEARLLVNGETTAVAPVSDSHGKYSSLLIGRDSRQKKIHIFPINYINGIIDEVKVWNKALTENDFNTNEIKQTARQEPDLSVPEIRFKDDFNRPEYHILPAANWTNETHGLIYYKGRYHIFNQKNGTNVYLGRINWGHYSSPDLVQWTEHRPVLTPEKGYDQFGIWSGHAVIDENGEPVIMYTGGDGNEFGMCLAFPKDDHLIEWDKYGRNPVVQGPPDNFERIDFRDPYLWKENDTWYMIIGFGLVEKGVEKGTVLLYKSKDMKNWEFLHPLYKGNPSVDDTGMFWEMPVFWKLNDKYILLINPTPHDGKPAVAVYWTGKFENERFVPDHKMPKRLEVINRMLSPSVSLDEDGRTTAIAIIPDLIPAEMQMQQGWTHLYSIPRTWDLVDGYIHQKPHPNLKKLRLEEKNFNEQKITPTENISISKGKHQLEIIARITPVDCKQFGFIIGKNEENGEETKIFFDMEKDEMVVDLTKSSQNKWIEKKVEKGDYKVVPNKEIEIHLFIDGSVVEGFINGKDGFTTRIFPEYKSSNEVELFAAGGSLKVSEMQMWELKSSDNKTNF